MSPSASSTSVAVAAQAAANATVAKLQLPSMYSSVYIAAPVASELQERSRTTSSVYIAASEPEVPSRTFSNSIGALARGKFVPLLRLVPPCLYLSFDYRLRTHLSPDEYRGLVGVRWSGRVFNAHHRQCDISNVFNPPTASAIILESPLATRNPKCNLECILVSSKPHQPRPPLNCKCHLESPLATRNPKCNLECILVSS